MIKRGAAGKAEKQSTLRTGARKYLPYYLVFLPVFLYFAVFHYAPMYGILLAFKDYKYKLGITGSPWIDPWYKHFATAFSSAPFRRAFVNTLWISFLKVFVAFPFPIALALMIDELRNAKFKKTLQTISYLPYFISWVVLSGVLRNLLSPSYGSVNALIKALGGKPIFFFGEAKLFPGLIFFTYLWQSIGYNTIVYLAAISSVDQQMIEAAKLDGASRIQIIFRITIPTIMPVIIVLLVLNMGKVMNAGFDQIFNMYAPVTYETGDILDTYVYRVGLVDQKFGFSTAVNLFKNLIGLALVLITNSAARRIDRDSALF